MGKEHVGEHLTSHQMRWPHKKTIWGSAPSKWGYDIIKERKKKIEDILVILQAWFKISINTDILVLEFYGYIRNIGE